jgi:hypothetical protein
MNAYCPLKLPLLKLPVIGNGELLLDPHPSANMSKPSVMPSDPNVATRAPKRVRVCFPDNA